jgi:NAD(P)-dependent dehydrogenase (short-subunit alcohol dehydrogenase family)
MAAWTTRNIPDQSGNLAIVTGATGGLGFETALGLVGAGAEVVLAGRNSEKGLLAETQIRQRYHNAKVRFEILDLADLVSVSKFADRVLSEGRTINILVNNAGIMAPPKRQTTADGFELQFGTNYLGHFALTGRLLPLLKVGKARVVELSSIAHRSGKIHFEDLNFQKGYKPFPVYGQSKLAMLMFAVELDRRSKQKAWGLTSVAAHPGFARTDLVDNGPAVGANALMTSVIKFVVRGIGHSASAGALPTLMAATLPDVQGGEYFGPQGWMEFKGPPGPGKIDPKALDAVVATRLWSESERATGVVFG